MSYSGYCHQHRKSCKPIYYRPDNTAFKRVPRFVFCEGGEYGGHILIEHYGQPPSPYQEPAPTPER